MAFKPELSGRYPEAGFGERVTNKVCWATVNTPSVPVDGEQLSVSFASSIAGDGVSEHKIILWIPAGMLLHVGDMSSLLSVPAPSDDRETGAKVTSFAALPSLPTSILNSLLNGEGIAEVPVFLTFPVKVILYPVVNWDPEDGDGVPEGLCTVKFTAGRLAETGVLNSVVAEGGADPRSTTTLGM